MVSPEHAGAIPSSSLTRGGTCSREFRLRCVFALLVCGVLASASVAGTAGFQVLLRNDLTPGSLSTYVVRIQGVRTTPGRRWEEQVTFEQVGRLTLVVLDAGAERQAHRVWMMSLDDPRVVSVEGAEPAGAEELSAKALGLPPKAAQLRMMTIDARRAPASAVGGSRVQRAALLLALDFAHWPDGLVRRGDGWETPAGRSELEGAWRHRFTGTEGSRSQRLAVGSFTFEGRLAGDLAQVAGVKHVVGTWKWRVAKRALQSASADVVLSYGERERPRELAMHVELELERRERIPRGRLAATAEELAELNALARDATKSPTADAKAGLARFVETHADSLWLPVARDMLEKIALHERRFAALDKDGIVEALTSLVTRWQSVALAGDLEPLQPIRATFRELMRTKREILHGLAGTGEPNTRAMAVFCVAFGEHAEDLARVVACCKDESSRVRAWAAYGLAERRDGDVEPALLRALLADEDDKVRQRACMAVQGSLHRESPHRGAFVALLLKMARADESHAVHVHAAEAIDALAMVADLPALIEAEYEQEVPAARRQLEATIRRLGGEPREVADE